MNTIEIKEQFIELRAKGWSFDKIAKKLGKSKQALIDWGRELQEEIANLKALELEALYNKYHLHRESRLRAFGEMLQRLTRELNTRDLSEIQTDKLLDLLLKYHALVKEEYIEPSFKSSREMREERIERETLEELISPTEPDVRELKAG